MENVAIAILNYNGLEFLKKFLPTLIQNSNQVPIYIGDNASTDHSVAYLKTNFPEVKCVVFNTNHGYSKGYNLLIDKIEASFIALVNSDIEVTTNWLPPLIHAISSNKKRATVQPKIKSYHNKSYFEYAGACGGYIDKLGYPFCRGRIFDTIEQDKRQYETPVTMSWSSGACFVVRKSYFDEVGGFDDDFFAHMEEIDLCWRLSNKGYTHHCIPNSTVFHVGGGTLSYQSKFKTYLNYRNGLFLLIKNVPKNKMLSVIIQRILLDWLSAFYLMAKGNFNQSLAVPSAHISVLKTWKKFKAKRSKTITSNNTVKSYSIIWNYFIKGKKRFSQLP